MLRPERGLVANSWLVAKREFRERVRSRLFFVSTILLAALAVGVVADAGPDQGYATAGRRPRSPSPATTHSSRPNRSRS